MVPERRRRASSATGCLLSISFPLFLIVVWEIVTQVFGVPAYVLPAPGSVATSLAAHISQLAHFGLSTVVETVAGFAIAAVAGMIIAAGIAYSKVLSRIVYPSLVATQSIPKIAIGPLFVGWLGLGLVPKIAMAAITAVFPIVINTAAGLKEIDPT